LAEAKNTSKDGSSSDTAFKFVDFCSGFVDIEGADDDETRIGSEVADGDGDAFNDVFVDRVNVVF